MNSNINNPKTIYTHKKIIRRKKYLEKYYIDCYNEMQRLIGERKPVVELGSGGGFFTEVIEGTITSDIVKGPDIDRVFSATKMPFQNKSVGAFVMFSVLHHIKNPNQAFKEMQRSLKPNGKIVMIEPFNSFMSGLVFKNLHSEGFDQHSTWRVKGKERLTDANLALPWIIFYRDRKIFEAKFPSLRITKIYPHTALRYYFSGGVTHPWTFPGWFYVIAKLFDFLLSPVNKLLAVFMTIELQKK